MANVTKAIEFMLHQEDADLCGEVTNWAHDRGGLTRFGLCAKFHPKLVEAGFYDPKKVPQAQALVMAEETYQDEYAIPLRLRDFTSDEVAIAMVSFAVLDGIGSALRVLRAALYIVGFNVPLTSAPMDDATFRAEQAAEARKLVQALVQQQTMRCEHIAAQDPRQQKWIKGWENRADQVLALVQA